MKQKPKISDAEWKIMQVIWSMNEATANQVVEALKDQEDWNPKTIRTLINRLVNKKALTYLKKDREYLYKPVINEDECVKAETKSFLSRISKKALRPMLAAFVEEHDLTDKEIDELKKMLDKKNKRKA